MDRTLPMSRCASCHVGFLPRAGPCPRCGARAIVPFDVPASGVVVAATELSAVAAGWTSPHRLALVELEESIRVLAVVRGELPPIGSTVELTVDRSAYSAELPSPGTPR